MKIKEIYIDNYRNLSGLTIKFDGVMNFIIGNNGVGKSNLMELIDTVFNKNAFKEKDFSDTELKIQIIINVILEEYEIGYFDDLFEPQDPNCIKIIVSQDKPNGRIEFKHFYTDTPINYSKLRNLPCVYYNSINITDEIDFSKNKNAGKFLNFVIENYVKSNDIKSEDIIKTDKISEITDYMDKCIKNIEVIKNEDISSKIDNSAIELLPKLLGLKNDNNISINNMGSGTRYFAFVFFEILNSIVNNLKYNDNSIITTESGERILPMIVLLDEPEIHLHPFMQRNLIRQIREIINNKNLGFNNIIKEWFNIDLLNGQVIIVTHSNNIISNNYKEYIRLYNEGNSVNAISASEIMINRDNEKHLLRQGREIKESFFAKVVLVYEGISEKGCIENFAEKLEINLDENNIGVISGDGAGNVKKIKELLEMFNIETVCVLDRDVYNENDEKKGILYTMDEDLELDIINKLIINKATKKTIKIIKEYENKKIIKVVIQKEQIKKAINKTKETIEIKDYNIKEAIKSQDNSIIKNVLYAWFTNKKDMIRGRIVGEVLSLEDIPEIYVKSIRKAQEIADEL